LSLYASYGATIRINIQCKAEGNIPCHFEPDSRGTHPPKSASKSCPTRLRDATYPLQDIMRQGTKRHHSEKKKSRPLEDAQTRGF
jgi:hypothetical protein